MTPTRYGAWISCAIPGCTAGAHITDPRHADNFAGRDYRCPTHRED